MIPPRESTGRRLGLRNLPVSPQHRRLHCVRGPVFASSRTRRRNQGFCDSLQEGRKLSDEGARIRIVAHRLFIHYFHNLAVSQTVDWLDRNGIPYWDLCFMKDKEQVGADIYVEDSPADIGRLRGEGFHTICFGNSANKDAPLGLSHGRTFIGSCISMLMVRLVSGRPGILKHVVHDRMTCLDYLLIVK